MAATQYMGAEMRKAFSDRLKELCNNYYETYMDLPPVSAATVERMNSLLQGTRNPTLKELLQISEDYDVSINYLLTGDELYPSLHRISMKEAETIQGKIEKLKNCR